MRMSSHSLISAILSPFFLSSGTNMVIDSLRSKITKRTNLSPYKNTLAIAYRHTCLGRSCSLKKSLRRLNKSPSSLENFLFNILYVPSRSGQLRSFKIHSKESKGWGTGDGGQLFLLLVPHLLRCLSHNF